MKLAVNLSYTDITDELLAIPILEKADDFRCVMKINETAQFLLQLLEKPVSEGEIIENMSRRYQISQEQAANDVKPVLEKLRRRRMIET